MPKQSETQLVPLKELQQIRRSSKHLTLTICIPGQVVPLFNAFAEMAQMDKVEYARHAVLRWLASNEAMEEFDEFFNSIDF